MILACVIMNRTVEQYMPNLFPRVLHITIFFLFLFLFVFVIYRFPRKCCDFNCRSIKQWVKKNKIKLDI